MEDFQSGEEVSKCLLLLSFHVSTNARDWNNKTDTSDTFTLKKSHLGFTIIFLLGVSVKIQIGLPFWCRLTRVVPDTVPLNGCVCVCVCVRV